MSQYIWIILTPDWKHLDYGTVTSIQSNPLLKPFSEIWAIFFLNHVNPVCDLFTFKDHSFSTFEVSILEPQICWGLYTNTFYQHTHVFELWIFYCGINSLYMWLSVFLNHRSLLLSIAWSLSGQLQPQLSKSRPRAKFASGLWMLLYTRLFPAATGWVRIYNVAH